jgi:DNA repair exonuclease SbcCD ATPase subunit
MEIELVNFRCWKQHTVKFNDKGLILLSGGSGSGKSSILNGIYFVLTGVGNKLITHGQTKCYVKILLEDGPIQSMYRSKGPCRLLIQLRNGAKLEDDEAQKMIDSTYGKYFQYTSYMTQKMVHSFLSMSQCDKLNFLQKFVLEEDDIQLIKKQCKDEISILKKKVLECTGKLEILKNELNAIEMPKDVSTFSQQVIMFDPEITEGLKMERSHQQLIVNEFEICLSQSKFIQESKHNCEQQLFQFQNKLQSVTSSLQSLNCKDDKYCSALESYLENLQTLNSIRECEEKIEMGKQSMQYVEEEHRQFFENEKTNLLHKLSLIREMNLQDNDLKQFEEHIKVLVDFHLFERQHSDELKEMDIKNVELNIENCMDHIQQFSETVLELDRKLIHLESQYQMQLKSHQCPSCKSLLKFVTVESKQQLQLMNEFQNLNNDEIQQEIQNVRDEKVVVAKNLKLEQQKINRLETNRKQFLVYKQQKKQFELKLFNINNEFLDQFQLSYTSVDEFLQSLNQNIIEFLTQRIQQLRQDKQEKQHLQDTLKTVESKIQSLNNGNHPILVQKQNNIIQWQNRIILLKKSLHDISEYLQEFNKYTTTQQVQNEITLMKQQQQQQQLLEEQKKEYTEQINNLSQKIQSYNSNLLLKENFIKEHYLCSQQLQILDHKIKDQEELSKLHILFQHNQTILKQRKRLDEQIRRETYIFDDCNEEIVVHEMFLSKIQEAESASLMKCIDSVNYFINEYLESFFTQEPILVNIHPFKNVNNEIKCGINIKVLYKGEEIDVNSLSGGEYDRVALAIMLAFNHICKSDMILLDESIASLDSELTNDILNSLKQNLSHKRIIVVAHQLSTGIFDQIVSTQ